MLKILIIHTHYLQHGGEDTVVKQEISLLKKKHEVECVFFKNKKGVKGLTQFLFSIWNIKSANIVKKKIKNFKPDLIHLHNWHFASGPLIIRAAKKLKIPIVHTLHNYRLICPSGTLMDNNQMFVESIAQNFPWTAVRKQVYRNSMALTFWLAFVVWFHKIIGTWKMIDSYICLTPSAIDLFSSSNIGIHKDKFISKPNFSPLNNDDSILDKEDCFLFVGRLTEEKGVRLLIKAFETLSYKLKIVGEGPLKEYVLDATNSNSNISYLGVLKKEDVCIELKKANALIFPSIWLEPFGLVITEAFSSSCAVISTNIGAPKSLIENKKNGFHFESNNVHDLISIIKKWESLTIEEKEVMRKHALKVFLSKYSPKKQDAFFNNIYINAIENK